MRRVVGESFAGAAAWCYNLGRDCVGVVISWDEGGFARGRFEADRQSGAGMGSVIV